MFYCSIPTYSRWDLAFPQINFHQSARQPVTQILQQQSTFASLELSSPPGASEVTVCDRSKVFASGEVEIYSSISMLFGSVRWAFLSSWRRPCGTLKRKHQCLSPCWKENTNVCPLVTAWKETVKQHFLLNSRPVFFFFNNQNLWVLLLAGLKEVFRYFTEVNMRYPSVKTLYFKFYPSRVKS